MTFPPPSGPDPALEPAAPPRLPGTPLALTLVGVCVALFAGQQASPLVTELGRLYGPAVAEGQWWRLLTNTLLHGNLAHLFFNLSAVWTIGRQLERLLGTGRFALLTLAGALGASAAVLAANFAVPTLGISGVILAWGGFALPVADPDTRRQLRIWLLQVAAISLLPGVSWAGHLGGFLAGLAGGGALRLGLRRLDLVLAAVTLIAGGACVAAVLINR